MVKIQIVDINQIADSREESGELLVHKCMKDSMSIGERFRFNLCAKILEIRIKHNLPKEAFVSLGVSIEEMRRIQHKHYDYFVTNRLLEILNVVLQKTNSEPLELIK